MDNWIQKAVPKKDRGVLKRWAVTHGFIKVNGDINLKKAKSYARSHGLTKRMRQIDLAITFSHMRKRGTRKPARKKKKEFKF